jgi:hypothetical protein
MKNKKINKNALLQSPAYCTSRRRAAEMPFQAIVFKGREGIFRGEVWYGK